MPKRPEGNPNRCGCRGKTDGATAYTSDPETSYEGVTHTEIRFEAREAGVPDVCGDETDDLVAALEG